jgi:fatty acid/phospholipid biosynthesis enzyme
MDPEAYGGASLLGFNGAVLKAHASARERAISSAIGITARNLQHHVNELIVRDVASANERLGIAARSVPPSLDEN